MKQTLVALTILALIAPMAFGAGPDKGLEVVGRGAYYMPGGDDVYDAGYGVARRERGRTSK